MRLGGGARPPRAAGDLSETPIVVLGANHSGTRLLVEVLTALGSDPGAVDDEWRENRLFLALHRELVAGLGAGGWNRVIFDQDFLRRRVDAGLEAEPIRSYLAPRLDAAFPRRAEHPWHWKCPTAILFLRSWLEVYPDAYYVHLCRVDRDVAMSLLRRRNVRDPRAALAFNGLMNARVEAQRPRIRRYLRLDYEQLADSLDRLAAFLPWPVEPPEIERARCLITPEPARQRRVDATWRLDVWLLFCRVALRVLPLRGRWS